MKPTRIAELLVTASAVLLIVACGGLTPPSDQPPVIEADDPALVEGVAWAVPPLACPVGDSQLRLDDGKIEQWCVKGAAMHGPTVQWYGEGRKAMEGLYVNGKREDAWTWWHPNGQKSAKGEYRRDRQFGTWVFWHDNGETAETGDFLNGMRAGTWNEFHRNGVRSTEGSYVNGEKDGEWSYFDEVGKREKIARFRNGQELQ